jgi:Flp pilus assembly protein TadG
MRVKAMLRSLLLEDRGGVLVKVALWLPVLCVLMTFVIDAGNWFVHKRHLQMQADAAALAGAQEYGIAAACNDSAIRARVAQYSGGQYNAQIGGTPAGRVFVQPLNSKTFYGQPSRADDTPEGTPCTTGMIDVKVTETDLPWFFRPVAAFMGGAAASVPFINAHARVSVNQIDSTAGSAPIVVPDTNPNSARAYFINEGTGAVLGSTALTKVGTSNGLVVWDNAAAPLPVKVDTADTDVGVVIALGGGSSTTCGQPLVDCYDAGSAATASGMPSAGPLYIRGWSAAGTGAQPDNDPILREATLVPGTCTDPYFSSAATTCTIGVRARVDFGTVGGVDQTAAVGATLTAKVGGSTYTLAYDTATKLWSSATTGIPISPGAGPVPVTLDWAETKGKLKGDTCSTNNGNKCKGTFGAVQRAFAATESRSGPIKVAQVLKGGDWANALERCSSVQPSCTHDLVVRIGVRGSLANDTKPSDPPTTLRVATDQGNSLDCDPAVSALSDELAKGCAPEYRKNAGTACPGTASALWATAQPWACVAVTNGVAKRPNEVAQGLNERILCLPTGVSCGGKATSCTNPNNWSRYPNIPKNDPRIVGVFLTPLGALSGAGGSTVPVVDFATFYVTGWTGSGQGFSNPCQGKGDDPVPDNNPGFIVGHFIKYIQNINAGTGTQPCDPNAFGSCVAAMTR